MSSLTNGNVHEHSQQPGTEQFYMGGLPLVPGFSAYDINNVEAQEQVDDVEMKEEEVDVEVEQEGGGVETEQLEDLAEMKDEEFGEEIKNEDIGDEIEEGEQGVEMEEDAVEIKEEDTNVEQGKGAIDAPAHAAHPGASQPELEMNEFGSESASESSRAARPGQTELSERQTSQVNRNLRIFNH
jgi:hypothetical protein